jgi:hypothetical protein
MASTRIWLIASGLVVGTTLGAAALATHAPTRTGTAAGTLASDDSASIDPDAVAALDKMGRYLRTLKSIQVRANVTSEEVTMDGQKVAHTSVVDLLAQRPNRLRAEVANDRAPRVFFYNGKTFTMYAPKLQYYAQTPAPSTINGLADQLDDKYDIDLPLVDLFRWGTTESDFKELTSAVDLGPSVVDGTTCDQYVFRQAGLDWQLWIQQGDYPLPRKLVITTTTDDARPQHTSVWTWNLAPSFNEAEFEFTPPTGARRISFVDYMAERSVASNKGKR